MKNILMIGFFLPFVPMILVSGVIYYQLHEAYEENVHAHLIETTQKAKKDIDRFFHEKEVDGSSLHQLVKEVAAGTNGMAYILDEEGKCIICPSQKTDPEKSPFIDFPAIRDKSKGEIVLAQRKDRLGQKNIYTMAFLNESGWRLVVRQSASDAFSGFQKRKVVIFVTILLAGLLIAANAYSLSKKTVHRIEVADARKQKMNEQMFQTGKLASIGELASGIAHEINNPVAIMVEEAGWIDDLLQEEEFKESENLGEFKRALKQIRAQGKRCKEITHKLLSFARKTDFRVQPVQLSELIEDITAISVKSVKTNNVIITVDIQEDLPELSLPRTEVQQVLLNLIKNALDAMEDKGGTLSISAHLVKDNLMIKVSDNGPGIPEEDLKRIFDPFYTTKPVGKGTGLGLSICYGIIRKMGGEIGVESSEELGTIFRVVIPISKEGEKGSVSFTNVRDVHKSAGTLCI